MPQDAFGVHYLEKKNLVSKIKKNEWWSDLNPGHRGLKSLGTTGYQKKSNVV